MMEKMPASSYGFACGYRRDFHAERTKIPEALFDLHYIAGKENMREALMDVSTIASTAAGMCDADMKQVRFPFFKYKDLQL